MSLAALVSAPGFFDTLSAICLRLCEGLEERARTAGVPFLTTRVGGMFGLFFTEAQAITSFDDVMACDAERFRRFFHAMLDEGVYLAPSAYEADFVSAAHDDQALQHTFQAAEKAFRLL